MILAIDIGNTTVALGGIKDGRVCFVAHMDTVRTRTAAEYRIEMEKVFEPNADDAILFQKRVEPLFAQVLADTNEIQQLSELQNALLSQLSSR